MHHSLLEVTEEGTEAAAFVPVLFCSALISKTPTFCAEYPFLFLIQHSKINGILFCG
jgi:serpin B